MILGAQIGRLRRWGAGGVTGCFKKFSDIGCFARISQEPFFAPRPA